MSFKSLDVSITGSSADAVSAIETVKASLGGLERDANDAQDSVEELGDSTTGSSGSMLALATTASASAVSVAGLSTAASVGSTSMKSLAASTAGAATAIAGLATVAAPLLATLGGIVTAGASVAGVFGLMAGATVATQFEELKAAAAEAKEGLLAAVEPLGKVFLPVLTDLLDRVPGVAAAVVDALGPLDPFAEAFERAGNAILDVLPAIAEFGATLAREAIAVLEDLTSGVGDSVEGFFRGMMDVTRAIGPLLLDFGGAVGDLLPDLTELGTKVLRVLIPALTDATRWFEDVYESVNNFLEGESAADIFAAIRREIVPLIPRFRELHAEFKPVLDEFIDALPQIIEGFAAFSDSVLDIAETVTPVVVPALVELIDLIGDASEYYADWVENSERNERKLIQSWRNLKERVRVAIGRLQNKITAATATVRQFGDRASAAVADFRSAVASEINSAETRLSEFSSWVKTAGANAIGGAFDAVADAVMSPLDGIEFGGITETLDSLLDTAESVADTIDSIEIPSFDIGVPPEQQEPGNSGQGIFPGLPGIPDGLEYDQPSYADGGGGGDDDDGGSDPSPASPDIGDGGADGVSDPRGDPDVGDGVSGLATGGLIESTGAAILHAGERVVPEAQIADRGPAPIQGGGLTINIESVNASGRAEGRAAGQALKNELKRFGI